MDVTERQLEMLRYVSHGYSNGEIAKKTNVALDTVKTHLRRLFAELGAVDRAHAVRIGFEEGMLFPAEHRRPRVGVLEPRAARLRMRRVIDGRFVAVNAPRHGVYTTYTNWACRCEPCTVANREKQRGYRSPAAVTS